MRFGYWVGNGYDWPEILRSGTRAEQAGWDGLWYADHFMPNQADVSGPIHEVWGVLTALGAVTERVRLGSLVCGNTYRNPAVLAKQAATADHVSAGRIVLGIGAGWQQNEHEAYGLEYGTFTDRFERLEEALQVLRGLRSQDRTTFKGDHYQMADAPLEPKPVGPLPIMIGGGGERKTLRMVAQYADEWNVWATPEIMAHKAKVLDEHCERSGRDPSEIQRSACFFLALCDTEADAEAKRARPTGRPTLVGTPEQLQEQVSQFAELGVDELIVPDFNLPADRKADLTDRFLADVAAPFCS